MEVYAATFLFLQDGGGGEHGHLGPLDPLLLSRFEFKYLDPQKVEKVLMSKYFNSTLFNANDNIFTFRVVVFIWQ